MKKQIVDMNLGEAVQKKRGGTSSGMSQNGLVRGKADSRMMPASKVARLLQSKVGHAGGCPSSMGA